MLVVGLGSTADAQPPSAFMSTEYQGPLSSARNWTCARPTASAGVKQASRRGNRPASTQPTSLWAMATCGALPAPAAVGAAGLGGGVAAGAAAGLSHCALTYPSTPARVRTRYHSPARSSICATPGVWTSRTGGPGFAASSPEP